MAKYMINICYGDGEGASHPEDDEFIMSKYQEWSDKLNSVTLSANKLKDGEGRRLTMKNNEVVDGPYVEAKESIGGFYIIEVSDYDKAVELAKECPSLIYQGCMVDVREVEF